jgi:drug/metabolite transporter (DMT)-like permease
MESGGMSALRVSEVRATGSAVLLLGGLALVRRHELRIRREEVAFLAALGLVALAISQFLYFVSIRHLAIGVALVIVNLAVVLVALWARFFGRGGVQPRLWVAIALALGGLGLVAQFWRGLALDALGLGAATACALTYAAYLLMAERSAERGRAAYVLVAWGFLVGALFWAVAQPWWSFPYELLGRDVSLLGRLDGSRAPVWLLLAFMVPFGSLLPFVLYASALRYIPATHVVIAAVLEPVLGSVVAFVWLEERLGAFELAGGLLVLAGVVLAQTALPRAAAPAPSAATPSAPVEA